MGWKEYGILALSLVAMATGHSSNADPRACGEMKPFGHGIPDTDYQPFPSPFSITASSDTYTPNQEITVTLEGKCGRTFKGFLVQARAADPAVADAATVGNGTFTNADGNSKPWCTPQGQTGITYSITHTGNSEKSSVTMTWRAPSTAQGHLVFVVTFVESFSTVWIRQKSSIIKDASVQGSAPTYAGVPSAVLSSCSTGAAITRPAGCGQTMGCFDDCDTTGCNNIVTWMKDGTNMAFTIKGKFPPGVTSAYMALGFSDDKKMGSDGVTECTYESDQMNVHNSQNNGRSNSRSSTASATMTSGSYADGTFECAFQMPMANTNSMLDLNKRKFLLLARATSVGGSNLGKHSERPLVSGAEANFQENQQLTIAPASDTLVKVHGSLMVIAWIFAASLGIVIARYYKPQWPESTCVGEKVWFQMHRSFMILAFLACVTAFIIIFVDVMGYSELGEEASKKAHPILGIIVTVLCVLNPIMALFRPHPGDANRPIFNWAHFGVGSVAHILAVVTIFLGVNLGKPAVPGFVTWILVGYVVWQVLIELLLTFAKCSSEKKDRSESYELSQKGYSTSRHQESSKQGGSGVRQILLLVHIVAITAVTAAIVVFIVIS